MKKSKTKSSSKDARNLPSVSIMDIKGSVKKGREKYTVMPDKKKSIVVRVLSLDAAIVNYHQDVPIITPKQKKKINVQIPSPGDAQAAKIKVPNTGLKLSEYDTSPKWRIPVYNKTTERIEILEAGRRIMKGIKEVHEDDDDADVLKCDIRIKGVEPSSAAFQKDYQVVGMKESNEKLPKDVRKQIEEELDDLIEEMKARITVDETMEALTGGADIDPGAPSKDKKGKRAGDVAREEDEDEEEDDEDEDGDDDEIEVGDTVTWGKGKKAKTGEVVKIKGDVATVEDEDEKEHKVDVSDLTKAAGDDDEDEEDEDDEDEDEDEDEDSEIEVGDSVTWKKGKKTLSGTVKKIKDDVATVEDEDGGKVKVDLDKLTKSEDDDEEEDEDDEDEDEDADEDEDSEKSEIEAGDKVTFKKAKKTIEGEVVAVRGEKATVEEEDGTSHKIDLEELTKVEEKAPAKKDKSKSKDDDGDGESRLKGFEKDLKAAKQKATKPAKRGSK